MNIDNKKSLERSLIIRKRMIDLNCDCSVDYRNGYVDGINLIWGIIDLEKEEFNKKWHYLYSYAYNAKDKDGNPTSYKYCNGMQISLIDSKNCVLGNNSYTMYINPFDDNFDCSEILDNNYSVDIDYIRNILINETVNNVNDCENCFDDRTNSFISNIKKKIRRIGGK